MASLVTAALFLGVLGVCSCSSVDLRLPFVLTDTSLFQNIEWNISARQTESEDFEVERDCILGSKRSGFSRVSGPFMIWPTAIIDTHVDFTDRATDTARIDMNDDLFVEALSSSELMRYQALKEKYDGGLNLPMFELLEIHVDTPNRAVELYPFPEPMVTNLQAKLEAISQIQGVASTTHIRITGFVNFTSTFRGSAVFVFAKVLGIAFCVENKQLLLSNRADDFAVATRDGFVSPGHNFSNLKISCISGPYC